jgi:alkylated DNA repair dioxygenase AlkB
MSKSNSSTKAFDADGLKALLTAKEGFSVESISTDESSWIAHCPGFLVPSEDEFADAWKEHPNEYKTIKMFGKDVLLPRYQSAYGKAYKFSGKVSEALPLTPLMDGMITRLNRVITPDGQDPMNAFNMCLCNWYEPQHYIGPHSDDMRQLIPKSPIASISWGLARTFVLTPKSKDGVTKRMVLNSGDMVIMGGSCQATHKHEVLKLKSSEKKGNRVNFTFRCFK